MLSFRSSSKKDDGEDVIIGSVEDGSGGITIGGHHGKFATTPSSTSPSLSKPDLFQSLSLDLRSLALFRVLLGFMVVIDLLVRSRSLFAHYANLGVWPVVEAINNNNAHSFSIHFSNGNVPFQIIAMIVQMVAAICYMLGLKTKISNILTWLLVLSLHNRNVLILTPGDDLLRILLFWSLFLPVGEKFSLDSAGHYTSAPTTNRYMNLISICFILQIIAFYWAGYMLKTGPEWEEGTAMYYLFSIDQYTTPFGYFVLRFPSLLRLLTSLYLWFELLVPIALILPLNKGTSRLTGCFVSIGFFTFLGLCLELGLYTITPVIASIALLPAYFWEKFLPSVTHYFSPDVSAKYWRLGGSTTLYYASTGTHPLSTKLLLQIANTFLGLSSPILAAEKPVHQNFEHGEDEVHVSTDIGKYLRDNRLLWVAVDDTGKRHARQKGVFALLSENPFTAPIVPILTKIEKPIAFIYSCYAFLYTFGWAQTAVYYTSTAPAYPQASRRTTFWRPRLSELVALVFIVYILWWNVGTVYQDVQLKGDAQWLGLALRIDQWWNMFTPSPIKDDGWFVIPGKLANGKQVDLFKGGGPVSYEKPTFVSRTFPDNRWRRFLMNLASGVHQDKRLFYGRYLCRQWNWYGKGSRDKDYLLKTFQIIYLKESTLENYRVKGPDPIVLWEHQC